MNRCEFSSVRCHRLTRQGYVLEVQFSDGKSTQVEKSATELSDFRSKIANEAKANQDIEVPDVKAIGVKKLFDTKKDEEKKKKAVDEFFQQILQLSAGGNAVKTFLNLAINNSAQEGCRQSSHFEDFSVGQYEDINEFALRLNEQPSQPTISDNSQLYAPVLKKLTSPPIPKKPSVSSESSVEVEAYAEIPAHMVKRQDRLEESPNLPTELGPSPKVPPKIGIEVPQSLKVSSETKTTLSNGSASASSVYRKPSSTSTSHAPLSPVTPLKSIPPMPTFAPPPMLSSDELPESIETVSDQGEVHIVAVSDYTSASDNILSFSRGSLASLIVQADSQWWCIKLGEAYGWVPADYWRKLNSDGECASASSKTGAPWFVGKLTRTECEELLMEHGKQQHFVVRESNNLVGHFALSVKYNDRVHHFPIELTEEKKYYIGKHHFKTVQSVISYYKKNALFYDDNEQGVTLGSPLVIVKH